MRTLVLRHDAKANQEFGYGGNMYNLSGVSDLSKAVKIYSSGRCHWVCLQYERRDDSFMHGPPFLYYRINCFALELAEGVIIGAARLGVRCGWDSAWEKLAFSPANFCQDVPFHGF